MMLGSLRFRALGICASGIISSELIELFKCSRLADRDRDRCPIVSADSSGSYMNVSSSLSSKEVVDLAFGGAEVDRCFCMVLRGGFGGRLWSSSLLSG